MINCEIELDLSLSKWYIKSEIPIIHRTPGNPGVNPSVLDVAAIETTGATFQINNAKLYLPVVTSFINDNVIALKNIKQRFKRTIPWNKYVPEITTQTQNNNSDYLIDSTSRNINRLFRLSVKNDNDDHASNSFYKY